MDVNEILNKDPRITELKKTYQSLLARKSELIMVLSQIEANIIKTMGSYETLAKELIANAQTPVPQQASTADENVEVVSDEVVDVPPADSHPTPMSPTAENTHVDED